MELLQAGSTGAHPEATGWKHTSYITHHSGQDLCTGLCSLVQGKPKHMTFLRKVLEEV